jgi:hypothetical protein
MSEKIINSFLSAIIGGAVAFAVVYSTGRTAPTNADVFKVKSLEVADSITLRSPENGEEMIVLRNDGLIFAKNKVATEHFLGKQFSGQILVGNRVMVSPDDLINTTPETWQFLAELGGNLETGGELFVRSPHGGNHVGKGVVDGQSVKIGFDKNDLLQFFALNNQNKEVQVLAMQQPKSSPSNNMVSGESGMERSQPALPVANQAEITPK